MRLPGFHTVVDLTAGAEVLRSARYGVIEIEAGRLSRVLLRPWPHVLTAADLLGRDRWRNWLPEGDFCRLWYNQPRRHGNFLALRYIESRHGTSFRSLRVATEVLDEIACLKGSDAIVCDVLNARVSPRLLARHGWAPHVHSRWHRHYIKRFYGAYPERSLAACPHEALENAVVRMALETQFEVAAFTACEPPVSVDLHASYASDGDLLLA